MAERSRSPTLLCSIFYQVITPGTLFIDEVLCDNDCIVDTTAFLDTPYIPQFLFPNAFSPNGDGINDLFFIGIGKSVALINYLKIFDRWREQVYEGLDIPLGDNRQGWDGFFNGKEMGSNVYIWIAEITFPDGFVLQYSGDISVLK